MFTRYLLRRFFRLFALVLLSTLFVYVLLDFVGNIKVWLQRDPKDVAEYYLNFVPNIVYLVMPVNLLLSVVGVVGSMARHLEIASMKTAGRSVLRITAPLLAVSVLIAGAMFWTTEEILPDANHRRLELAQPPTEQASKIRREKQKNRAVVVGENATYYFRTYSARSQRGHNVIVLKFDSLGVSERWDAMAMDWSDSVWLLRNGFHRTFLPNGVPHREPGGQGLRGPERLHRRPLQPRRDEPGDAPEEDPEPPALRRGHPRARDAVPLQAGREHGRRPHRRHRDRPRPRGHPGRPGAGLRPWPAPDV